MWNWIVEQPLPQDVLITINTFTFWPIVASVDVITAVDATFQSHWHRDFDRTRCFIRRLWLFMSNNNKLYNCLNITVRLHWSGIIRLVWLGQRQTTLFSFVFSNYSNFQSCDGVFNHPIPGIWLILILAICWKNGLKIVP